MLFIFLKTTSDGHEFTKPKIEREYKFSHVALYWPLSAELGKSQAWRLGRSEASPSPQGELREHSVFHAMERNPLGSDDP